MKERTRDAGGDRQEFALAVKDFDLWSAGKFKEIHGPSATNEGGRGLVGGDGREIG